MDEFDQDWFRFLQTNDPEREPPERRVVSQPEFDLFRGDPAFPLSLGLPEEDEEDEYRDF